MNRRSALKRLGLLGAALSNVRRMIDNATIAPLSVREMARTVDSVELFAAGIRPVMIGYTAPPEAINGDTWFNLANAIVCIVSTAIHGASSCMVPAMPRVRDKYDTGKRAKGADPAALTYDEQRMPSRRTQLIVQDRTAFDVLLAALNGEPESFRPGTFAHDICTSFMRGRADGSIEQERPYITYEQSRDFVNHYKVYLIGLRAREKRA